MCFIFLQFLFDLMVCSKMNDNESMVDFILQTPAPIYAAAKLSRHYRAESTREKERSRDLINAGNVCEILASELLSLACVDGAETLLTAVDDREVPFLDFLIECEQKECVSHPSVQLYLGDVWRGNFKFEDWKLFLLFICSILCPLLWVFLCLPWNIKYHKVPIIKFVCHLVSHIYLILLFCLTTVVPWGHSYTDLLPHWYEWLLLIWLSGLLLSQLTEPHDRAGLGWIPILVLVLSVIGILLHLIAFAFEGYPRVGVIYARNQLFAVAMMFCFTQLLDFLSFHHLFGPWGVIIRDLMQDLVRFLVILLIFMTGFTAHLAAVYKPMYSNDSKQSVLNPNFGFLKCFELLFFSLFGLTEIQLLDPSQEQYKFPNAMFTLARFTFGVYNIITIVVLINLLIAMMSDTYQRIQAQSDIEWKFGRAKLIRNMKRSTATPSPLNVFTKFVTYAKILFKTKCKCCRADIIDILRTGEPFTESTSMDPIYRGSNSSWLPNENLEHRENIPRIETVLDWSKIVKKFLALRGSNSEISQRQMPATYTYAMHMRERVLSADSHGALTPRTNSGHLGRSPIGFGSSVSLRGVANSTIKKVEVVHGIIGKESD